MKTRLWLAAAAACVALAVSALPSSAQQWPSRNVRVVVPYGVGGVTCSPRIYFGVRLVSAFRSASIIRSTLRNNDLGTISITSTHPSSICSSQCCRDLLLNRINSAE